MTVKVVLQDIKKLETEALIVGFHEDVRPLKGLAGELDWLLCGALSSLIINDKLRGSLGEVALLTSRGKVPAPKIFLVGLGPRGDFSADAVSAAARAGAASALGAGVAKAAIELFQAPGIDCVAAVPAVQRGLAAGAGAGAIDIALIAPDAAAYERLSKIVKEH